MKKRIGDVAKAAGVGVETVRFYQRAGLLDEPEKPYRGWRTYGPSVQQQLGYVHLARKMGLSVADIAGVKKSLAGDRSKFCEEVRKIVEQRLAVIQSTIAQLERARTELSDWLGACRRRSESSDCPLYRELTAMSGNSNKHLK